MIIPSDRVPRKNLIVGLTFEFSLKVIELVEILEASRKYAIANQLIRSGTSIGANVREAQNPESRGDFIHKMKIAAKEAEETLYWLEICQQSSGYPECKALREDVLYIKRVLSKIIATSRSRRN
jgi:four helix bundle protein